MDVKKNRFRSIGFASILLVVLVIYVGNVVYRKIEIKQLLDTVEALQGQKDSTARIEALEKLVKAGKTPNN
ncbi:MAG: hypothetical protein ACYTXY_55365, partial [Nostoc sp.]